MIDMMMIMTIVNLERDSTPIRADRSICTGYSLYLTLNAHCVSCDGDYMIRMDGLMNMMIMAAMIIIICASSESTPIRTDRYAPDILLTP